MTTIFDDIREAIERSAEPVTVDEIFERRTANATRRVHHRHVLLAGGSVPVAAAVVLAVVLAFQGGGDLRPTAPSASLVLDRLGRVADTRAAPQPGAGQFVYVDRQGQGFRPGGYRFGGSQPTFWVTFGYQIQSWTSTTATGQTAQSDGASTPARPSDQSTWEATGRPTLPGATRRTSTQEPDTSTRVGGIGISTLSTDPELLARQLQQAVKSDNAATAGDSGAQFVSVFSLTEELLGTWQLQPAVRSAAFQVLSAQPGVTVQTNAKNHAGRAGTGISAVQNGVSMQIVFDPITSDEVGYSSTIVNPAEAGYPANASGLSGWVVIAPPVIVGSLGSTT
jgi:hypothetical protein